MKRGGARKTCQSGRGAALLRLVYLTLSLAPLDLLPLHVGYT